MACSCPGYWYRRTCKHYRAYREAVALVLAQDAVNVTWDYGKENGMSSANLHPVTVKAFAEEVLA